jgi:hypothetical protein
MRLLTLAMWLCISSVGAAQATPPCAAAACVINKAPAPLIGSGVPVALIVGGVLLGVKLSARWRRS